MHPVRRITALSDGVQTRRVHTRRVQTRCHHTRCHHTRGAKNLSILLSMALIMLMAGCSSHRPPNIAHLDISMVLPPTNASNLPAERINEVLEQIEERNTKVEDDPEWIRKAYKRLMVRRLTNVSSREYESFQKYLDNGNAYIIVHPAFFTFFHYPRNLRDKNMDTTSRLNVVELLLDRVPPSAKLAILQAQERRMRDFLEFKSTQQKLIILVIPIKYETYSGYTYRKGPDEYMRFLNETTNLSHSVLFIESRSPNRGYLTDRNAEKLVEFLMSIKARKVLVGGGYIGRCLEDFYTNLTLQYGAEGIFVIPELSDISPQEMSTPIAERMLKPDSLIDYDYATQLLLQDKYDIQELIPRTDSSLQKPLAH